MEIKKHLDTIYTASKYFNSMEKKNKTSNLSQIEFDMVGLKVTNNYKVIRLIHLLRSKLMSINTHIEKKLIATAKMTLNDLKILIDNINLNDINNYLKIEKELFILLDC